LTGVHGGAVIIVGSAVVAFLLYGFSTKVTSLVTVWGRPDDARTGGVFNGVVGSVLFMLVVEYNEEIIIIVYIIVA
jgi:hypothetical protein